MLDLAFRFTPADGTPSRNIKVTIATQDDEKYPFTVTIDWDDGRDPDHLRWPGPPLFGLELAARFAAQRILDRVELWGGGTLHPEVDHPVSYAAPGEPQTT